MRIAEEGPRNAVVKLTGILDSSDASAVPAVALQDFTNNDVHNTLVGLRANSVEWSISNDLGVNLHWHATIPQQMYALAGQGRIHSDQYGGWHPDQSLAGYDGSVELSTTGFIPGTTQNFTITIHFIKLYEA